MKRYTFRVLLAVGCPYLTLAAGAGLGLVMLAFWLGGRC